MAEDEAAGVMVDGTVASVTLKEAGVMAEEAGVVMRDKVAGLP